jgi:hypothetical protein
VVHQQKVRDAVVVVADMRAWERLEKKLQLALRFASRAAAPQAGQAAG